MKVHLKRAAIETALVRRNWTKTALARLAGLHRTHLSDLLAGRASPGPRTRQRLLEVLGGEFDDFFEIIRGRGRITDEGRIVAILDHLRLRRGGDATAACRRLTQMLDGLRRGGDLTAADRSWLEGEWKALQAAGQGNRAGGPPVRGQI